MSEPDALEALGTVDVLVIGEPLVELSSTRPMHNGAPMRLGFSGDALNAAAAAAAAGARTALLARVPADELGDAMVAHIAELGVETGALLRVPGQHGVYLTHIDPTGGRQFAYARSGSATSALAPEDLPGGLVASAGVVVSSGVTCALSAGAAAAVERAARLARCFVYDPNFRPRLTGADAAAAVLRRLAPLARLVTPSWPGEARQLLGLGPDSVPGDAVAAVLALGAAAVAVTSGPDGVLLGTPAGETEIPPVPPPRVVDQTGAGDVLTGTIAARLALGDDLLDAVRLGAGAAALSVQGRGGTGYLPTLAESRAAACARGAVR
ncbi:2-dehydro-3-deoxygluconokinase [Prauserella shujinwangii]|uniref:2-dehydro-3-deoxygluconokinase n=1 Tax=Prauserella shujinwangii TaxID=1453103 RepID=A0A2T0LYZ2_9PSEU|nr:PfkB family carbohydrate kinase [Prauserella shujinwangii]PRX49333.1 2-dehydro-3-deoxygluconokinase [Prauserella shujinwangii]